MRYHHRVINRLTIKFAKNIIEAYNILIIYLYKIIIFSKFKGKFMNNSSSWKHISWYVIISHHISCYLIIFQSLQHQKNNLWPMILALFCLLPRTPSNGRLPTVLRSVACSTLSHVPWPSWSWCNSCDHWEQLWRKLWINKLKWHR